VRVKPHTCLAMKRQERERQLKLDEESIR